MVLAAAVLVLVAAYVAARATGLRRTAELGMATWSFANALVLVPMHALLLAASLSRASAMITTATLSVATLGAVIVVRGARAVARDLRDAFRIPKPGPVRRWLAAPFALAVAAVALHAIVAAVLLPSESWDGIWYHETITGWVIQTGSYAPMPLPENLLQQVNGFPRNAELASAWLALAHDRSLVELPNALALVPLAFGAYELARRFSAARWHAVALASIAALVPGAVLQLRSTYVDVYAAAAAVSAIVFATKRPFAPRDAALCALALALHIGAKSSALLVAPVVAVFALARPMRGAPRSTLLARAGVVLGCLVSGGLVYGKNLLQFDNPVYPIAVDIERLGLHLPGVRASSEVDVNATWQGTLLGIFAPAEPGRDFEDIRVGGYGLAFAWGILPLATLGLCLAIRRLLSTKAPLLLRARARCLLCLFALVLPSLVLTPALWSARYQLHAFAIACAPAAYALAAFAPHTAPSWRKVAASALLTALLARSLHQIATFDPPLGGAPLARLAYAWSLSPSDREAATAAEWTLEPKVARARADELGSGDVVVFGDGVTFPSVLYNDRFDNQMVYVRAATLPELDERVREMDPEWIVARPGETLYRYVSERPERWEVIGLASRGQPSYAYRRRPK